MGFLPFISNGLLQKFVSGILTDQPRWPPQPNLFTLWKINSESVMPIRTKFYFNHPFDGPLENFLNLVGIHLANRNKHLKCL